MLGLLLLFAWIQNSGIHAVAWWGCAHLLRAASVVLFGLYGSVSDAISIDFANAVLFTAFAVTWSGARVFDGRAIEPMYLVGGAVLWILLSRAPFFADSLDAKVLLSSSIITAYTWATAYEFWRGRGEPLVSRWPAIFMLFAHGALFLLRTPLVQVLPWSPTSQVFDSVWLTVLSFEALLFTIAIAFILLAMAKERTELRHKTAALVDPLTGIANRRAFLEEVIALSKRQELEARSAAVLLAEYGLRGDSGVVSSNAPVGPRLPYTSSVDTCRKRLTPAARAASSRCSVPATFVSRNGCAEMMLRSTWLSAAKFTTASIACAFIRSSIAAPSRMSARTKTCWPSPSRSRRFSRLPA